MERKTENNSNTTNGFPCLFIQWSFAPELISLAYSLLQEADPYLLHSVSFSKEASVQVCRRPVGKEEGGQGTYPHSLPLCRGVVVVASLQFTASVRHYSSSNRSLAIGYTMTFPLSLSPGNSDHFPLYVVPGDLTIPLFSFNSAYNSVICPFVKDIPLTHWH